MEGATPLFITNWAKTFNLTQIGNILQHPMLNTEDTQQLHASDLNYGIAINAKPLNFVTGRIFQFTVLDIVQSDFSFGLVTSSYDNTSRPGLTESSYGIVFPDFCFFANGQRKEDLPFGTDTVLCPGDELSIIARLTDDFKVI